VAVQNAVDRLADFAERKNELVTYCERHVLPHAAAEEKTLYRAAADLPEASLLVSAMLAEHNTLVSTVNRVDAARTPGETAAAAGALRALFESHLDKENDLLLPALATAGVDLAKLLEGMHEILGGHSGAAAQEPGAPGELDVRSLPPALRHERIFAKFGELAGGESYVLVNDHDPKPLRYQFEAEHAGAFTWEYLERGPEVWRVRIGKP
jgi:uncharacterized protein (DUF2249 family)